MRNLYGINVAGILRVEKNNGEPQRQLPQKVIYPDAKTKLKEGDWALVFRVPSMVTGFSQSVNIDSQIDRLQKRAASMCDDELAPKDDDDEQQRKVSDGSASGYPDA
eukprot:TRINITY_DN15405_c0_g1_i3.p1 TRINITY_DN15405_c0_g1~~TRINITY_DN15405_c0_g1_i3.p1  ORF type:complete len:107 (-),score=13.32 TRINITY_DN15405_c0_g1_i3:62-382(-)